MKSDSVGLNQKDWLSLSQEDLMVDIKAALGFDFIDLPLPAFTPWSSPNINDNLEYPKITVKEEPKHRVQQDQPPAVSTVEIKKEPKLNSETDECVGFSKIIKTEPVNWMQTDQPIIACWNEDQPASVTSTTSGGKWQCLWCSKRFKRKSNLQSHIWKNIEKKKTVYQCTTCFRSFPRKASMNRHIRMHNGEDTFKCEKCVNVFSDKYSLDRHLQLHKGKKPHKCVYCQRNFSRRAHLNSHIRIHTGDSPKMSINCVHCSKSFNCKSRLNIHLRSHTGERPFTCSHCSKKFAYKGNLTRHTRSHSQIGKKPYKCGSCAKAYTRNSILRSHVKKFHGLEPYVCKKCGESFTLKKSLDRHLGLCLKESVGNTNVTQ